MVDMTREEFEDAVRDALDEIPEELAEQMDNVVVLVEDTPPPDDPDLLGLYEGVPLTERNSSYGLMTMPDQITVFRKPICRMCRTEEQVVDEVRTTVVHELGHHVGIDEARLHELGWG